MTYTIQLRRDDAAAWTSVNPILHDGELGWERDTGKFKIGNGATVWNSLPYTSAVPDDLVEALDDLSDVDLTGAAAGKILGTADGLVWGPVDPPSGLPDPSGEIDGRLLGILDEVWTVVDSPIAPDELPNPVGQPDGKLLGTLGEAWAIVDAIAGGNLADAYKGAWAATTAYDRGDVVKVTDKKLYIAINDVAAGGAPSFSFVQQSSSGAQFNGYTIAAHGSAAVGDKQLLMVGTHTSVVPTTPSGWTLLGAVSNTHSRMTFYTRTITVGNIASTVPVVWADNGQTQMRTYRNVSSFALGGSGTGLTSVGEAVAANTRQLRVWHDANSNSGGGSGNHLTPPVSGLNNSSGDDIFTYFGGMTAGDDPTSTGTSPNLTATTSGTAFNQNPGYVNVVITPAATSFNAGTDWTPFAISSDYLDRGPVVFQTQVGTTYTLVLADATKFVTMSNAAASTLVIPPSSSVDFPLGTQIEGAQLGAGQVTLTEGSGVTIVASPGKKIAAQYGVFSVLKIDTDTWLAYGRLSA